MTSSARPMSRLRKLLDALRDYPEVGVFEGHLEGLGQVRVVLARGEQREDDDQDMTRAAQPEPVDWRWGT